MVKKNTILPAVATLALGVAGLVNVNNANAYVVTNDSSVENAQICHTLNNIINPVNNTFTFSVESNGATGLDLSQVSIASGSAGTVSYDSVYDSLTVTLPFTADGSTTPVTKCVGLNFSGAMSSTADFGDKTLTVTETASTDPTQYPVDSSSKSLGFAYELKTDNNGAPIPSGNDYQSTFKLVKDEPTFTSSANATTTYITLDKKVRGNGARTEQDFTFTINLAKPTNASATKYNVYVDGVSTTPQECYFTNASGYDPSNPCTVTLKHNQKAYIGCTNCGSSSRSGTLYVGSGSSYSITETAASGYTTSYAPVVNGVVGSETSGNTFSKNALEENDEVLFYNEKNFNPTGRFLVIFPFVILAIAAGATIIVVRKSSKNKEQA